MSRFDVDRKGLAKLLEGKNKSWIVYELIQNSWDEGGVTKVTVTLEPVPGKPEAVLIVEDDAPDGFRDLKHAYTLCAESYKKADPGARGRYNIGEKFVFAVAISGEVATTTGTVVFQGEERQTFPRRKTDAGSRITVRLHLTRTELNEIGLGVSALIPPAHIETTFNGDDLVRREPAAEMEATLPTVIGDGDGILRPSRRKTLVRLYEPRDGETAILYECGIPVVVTGDRWHVDVHQKVPLNMQRDNVTPAYLKHVRALVLSTMHEKLEADQFAAPWVAQAVADERVTSEAVGSYLDAKYGEKRVIADPKNRESVSVAQAAGYAVIHGGSESKKTWDKIKEADLARPAGQVFPKNVEMLPEPIPRSKWTPAMKALDRYARLVAIYLIETDVDVTFVDAPEATIEACYGDGALTFNVGVLGKKWLSGPRREIDALLLHELAHSKEDNHLSSRYYDALCDLGAKMIGLALHQPETFHVFDEERGRE